MSTDTVRIVHLITGEDIIGRIANFEDVNMGRSRKLVIADPVSPSMAMDPTNGNVRVGLMPIRPYAAEVEQMTLDIQHVVYITELSEQMLTAYTQFTSNIVLPTSPSLSSLLKP